MAKPQLFIEPQKKQKQIAIDFCALLYLLSSSLEVIEHRGTERTENKSTSVHSVIHACKSLLKKQVFSIISSIANTYKMLI